MTKFVINKTQSESRAHLLALEGARPGQHRTYNLGSGTGYTVREVVEACRRVTWHAVPTAEGGRGAEDPPSLVASLELIGAELGWTPEFDLDRIVADAWEFSGRRS